jgi:hypothetical protein
MLVCCGGVGGGVYYIFIQAKQRVEKFQDELKEMSNSNVNSANYQKLKLNATKAEVEAIMGPGKVATADAINLAFSNRLGLNKKILSSLQSMAPQDRVLMWQNLGEYIFAAFTSKPDSGGKLQLKVFVHPDGTADSAGTADDKTDLTGKNEDPDAARPTKPEAADKSGPATTVTAAKLLDDYNDFPSAAELSYGDKRLLVTEGVVERWDNEFTAIIKGSGKNRSKLIRVEFLDEQQAQIAKYKAGAKIKFRAKVVSAGDPIEMDHGWIVP